MIFGGFQKKLVMFELSLKGDARAGLLMVRNSLCHLREGQAVWSYPSQAVRHVSMSLTNPLLSTAQLLAETLGMK